MFFEFFEIPQCNFLDFFFVDKIELITSKSQSVMGTTLLQLWWSLGACAPILDSTESVRATYLTSHFKWKVSLKYGKLIARTLA